MYSNPAKLLGDRPARRFPVSTPVCRFGWNRFSRFFGSCGDLGINRLAFARIGVEIDSFSTTTGVARWANLTAKEQEMISSLLSCLLPLATSVNADFSVNVQVAPGISINLHSPSYYDQREKERQAQIARIEADREEERNHRASFERSKSRDQNGMYGWRDTREDRERERERLMDEERRHEEARIAQERLLREEEQRDREERRLAVAREREERMRAESREEEDLRHREEESEHRAEDRRHRKDDRRRQENKPTRTIHDDDGGDRADHRNIHD